jgi:hypothetical protein
VMEKDGGMDLPAIACSSVVLRGHVHLFKMRYLYSQPYRLWS